MNSTTIFSLSFATQFAWLVAFCCFPSVLVDKNLWLWTNSIISWSVSMRKEITLVTCTWAYRFNARIQITLEDHRSCVHPKKKTKYRIKYWNNVNVKREQKEMKYFFSLLLFTLTPDASTTLWRCRCRWWNTEYVLYFDLSCVTRFTEDRTWKTSVVVKLWLTRHRPNATTPPLTTTKENKNVASN